MINQKNYINAYFIDNERKNIEVLLKGDDGTSAYTHILEYDPEHPDCKELLEISSLDEIHENTWNKKKDEVKIFEDGIIKIAEKTGLIKKILKISQKAEAETFFGALFDFLLTDKKEHIDRLFNFKLHLFEQDVIKKSKDEEAKSNIRKAKTPLGAFKEFIKIWEESN